MDGIELIGWLKKKKPELMADFLDCPKNGQVDGVILPPKGGWRDPQCHQDPKK